MALTNNILAYEDVAKDLNGLPPEGGRRVCLTREEAYQWRARASKYRALLREAGGTTPFDHLAFRILQAEPNVVRIEPLRFGGHMETVDGKRLEGEIAADPLLDEAKRLAKELGLE